MKNAEVDLERMAALLDGRLDRKERDELLAAIAASDEATEVLIDAVAALREMEEAGNEHDAASFAPPTTPSEPDAGVWRRRLQTRAVRWLIAATIVGVAAAPLVLRRAHPAGEQAAERLIGAIGRSDPQDARELYEQTVWASTRGATETLSAEARAARLGARLVDLEMAVRARDTIAAPIADDIAALMEQAEGGTAIANLYRRFAQTARDGNGTSMLPLRDGRSAVLTAVKTDLAMLGAWAELGRVAARRHDAAFFKGEFTRSTLAQGERQLPPKHPASQRIARIRALGQAPGTGAWPELRSECEALLRALSA